MNSPQNKRKELEHILSKENFVKISGSIKMLRDETPFTGAIELLVAFYSKTDNSSVKRQITEFLNDLKDQSSCEEVISELKRGLNPETLRMLVSSCWQSGLNYSAYSALFADLFLTGDYLTAIECFTVVAASTENLTRQEKDSLIKQIREGSSGNIGEKKALALELISVLE